MRAMGAGWCLKVAAQMRVGCGGGRQCSWCRGPQQMAGVGGSGTCTCLAGAAIQPAAESMSCRHA